MLRTFAVALISATVLAAPALAQAPAATNPPANAAGRGRLGDRNRGHPEGGDRQQGRSESDRGYAAQAPGAPALCRHVQGAPALRDAARPPPHARRPYHAKHVKIVAHTKHFKVVKKATTKPAKSVKTASYGVKHHVRHVARKPVVATHSAAVTTAKPKSGTN